MEITLIINPGSSSKKFTLYKDDSQVLHAYVERTTDGFEMCTSVNGVQQRSQSVNKDKFHESLSSFVKYAKDKKVIGEISEIHKVVVRVVAPGTSFQKHTEITDLYIKQLRDKELYASLHIPHILCEIDHARKLLPDTKMIAASDSAFHSTIPNYIRNYSISEKETKDFDIYRFGYHGLSVASVVRRMHVVTGMEPKRAIVCHIGSGVSITAIKDGKSFDTTMGYSPANGLLMASRAGDLDIGGLLALMQARNLKPLDAETFIQNHGGLRGLTGEIDLRLLLEKRAQGEEVADCAIKSYVHHLQKAIGGFMAVLGGLDLLVFTATAGERSSILRSLVTTELKGLGVVLDDDKNELCVSRDGVISTTDSKVKVAVIRTDESDEMLRVGQGYYN